MADDPWAEFRLPSRASPASSGADEWAEFRIKQPEKSQVLPEAQREDVSAGMALRGIPVLGAYIPQAEAAIRAAAQPFTGVGKPGETFAERYAANLPEREAQYRTAETEQPLASGALQLGGGTVALAPLGATTPGARALGMTGSLPARLAAGGTSGAAISAADAAARGGSAEDIAGAAKWGAGIGAAAPMIAAGVRRAVSPFVERDPVRAARVAALQAEGYHPTAGEITGSRPLQWMEQHYGELGGVNRIPQSEQLGAAAWRRAGENATRVTPEIVDNAFNRIGQQFDDLAARNILQPDRAMGAQLRNAVDHYHNIVSPPMRAPAVANFEAEIGTALARNGNTLPGDIYQSLRSRMEATARGAPHDVADALRGMRGALDHAMERSLQRAGSPDLGAWREARNQYRNLLVLERVANNPNTQNGIVTPAGLFQATKQVQGVRNMARGRGDLQPLARAASDVLRGLPSSGTAQRTFYQNIPTALAGATAGALSSGGDPTTAGFGALAGLAGPPLMGRALMSRPAQRYLANQAAAGPAGQMLQGATFGGLLKVPPPQGVPQQDRRQFFQQQLPPGLTEEEVQRALNTPRWQPRADVNNYPDMPRINPAAWEAFIANAPRSRNIEDRR